MLEYKITVHNEKKELYSSRLFVLLAKLRRNLIKKQKSLALNL